MPSSFPPCHSFFPFLFVFLFEASHPFFPASLVPVSSFVLVTLLFQQEEGRPSLIESAVLYLLGPPQPFVCFSPISVASLASFAFSRSLVLFVTVCRYLSLSLSLSHLLLSASPSPLINGILATYNPLLFDRDRVLIAATTANGTSRARLSQDSNVVYRSSMSDCYDQTCMYSSCF